MVWSEKLKLNKQLLKSIGAAGLESPFEIQLKTLARISGGQDVLVSGPTGCGKTTTCVLSALNKFRQGFEDAPRVLMLVPTKEHVLEAMEIFELLNKNKTIRMVPIYPASGLEAQLEALADGADIVVATPDRARAIYLKLGLNLNRIQMLIVDDADLIVKQGLQLPVAELANSITKGQHLVFTEVVHEKLMKMISPFIKDPAIIEIDLNTAAVADIHEQLLYHVPNFRTKLNLLNLFLEDAELFNKVAVVVNTPATADKLFDSFKRDVKKEAMFFKQQSPDAVTVIDVAGFMERDSRILLAASGSLQASDLEELPFVIHFDVPESPEFYIDRVTHHGGNEPPEKLFISFATDIERTTVSRIEAATGVKVPVGDLPAELKIELGEVKRVKKVKPGEEVQLSGAAFHEKKASNAKTYNYGSGAKARMTMKKKHG